MAAILAAILRPLFAELFAILSQVWQQPAATVAPDARPVLAALPTAGDDLGDLARRGGALARGLRDT